MDTSQIGTMVGGFLQTLRPDSAADIMLYLIFFLALITTMLLPDDNAQATNLLYLTLLLAIFDLTVGQIWYKDPDITKAFPAFVVRVGLFLAPFIAAGSARTKGKKGRMGMPLSAVTGILGLLYFLAAFLVPTIMFKTMF